jgi:kynureninase
MVEQAMKQPMNQHQCLENYLHYPYDGAWKLMSEYLRQLLHGVNGANAVTVVVLSTKTKTAAELLMTVLAKSDDLMIRMKLLLYWVMTVMELTFEYTILELNCK